MQVILAIQKLKTVPIILCFWQFFGSVKYVNWVSTMSVRTGRINMVISDHFWLRVQKLHLLLKYSVCDIQSEGSCLKGRGMEVRMMCLEQWKSCTTAKYEIDFYLFFFLYIYISISIYFFLGVTKSIHEHNSSPYRNLKTVKSSKLHHGLNPLIHDALRTGL